MRVDVDGRARVGGLVRAAHPAPAVVVAAVAALLGVAAGLPAATVVVVTLAVVSGHLTIGWANDLLDAGRDRAVGRADKPLPTGAVTPGAVRRALVVAGVVCVLASFAAGWRSGLVHLVLGIGSGQAYNLGLKRTALSWLPYAVTFGTLPAVITLAGATPSWPPWWMLAAGATLGVGAHLLNALPDLADDLRTGVRGLPHRLGARAVRPLAAALLVAASLLAALGPGAPAPWVWAVLVVIGLLAAVALVGRGAGPFRAAMAVAVLDVVLLVAAA
jgi:4-hydroxybenzoate polyprenyltransferase